MTRLIFAALLVSVAGLGCGGYSTQEANRACEEERRIKFTLDEASFAECIACYEDCGDECTAQNDTPERYICPE